MFYEKAGYNGNRLGQPGVAKDLFDALDSPAVHFWFAQQCDFAHAKMRCVPLGAAYHDDLNLRGGRPRAERRREGLRQAAEREAHRRQPRTGPPRRQRRHAGGGRRWRPSDGGGGRAVVTAVRSGVGGAGPP